METITSGRQGRQGDGSLKTRTKMRCKTENARPVVTTAVVFGLLYILSRTLLANVYLFEWTARHYYLLLWVAALALGFSKAKILSYSITLGNLVGLVIGQLLGDFIVAQRVAQLPPDVGGSTQYWANYHHGVLIWLIVVLAFFLAGLVLNRWFKQ